MLSLAGLAAPVVCLCLAQTAGSVTVEDELRRAKNEYAYGNYDQAIADLRGLLYPMRLYTDEQVIETRRYLGLSYYLVDQKTDAREEFTKLLYLDPDYELDPFTVAPPIIELFEAVRKEHQPVLDGIRERQSEVKLGTEPAGGFRRTVVVQRTEHSEIATFLPFGVGQFQNGDLGWGIAFATVEAALLGVNIGCFLWLSLQEGDGRPGYYSSEADVVQAIIVTQVVSAALFGVTWSLGVLQARINFVPYIERRQVTDEPLADGTATRWRYNLNFSLNF